MGVVGLGYVGLPLALAFARQGFRTVGFDLDATKLEALRNGESYLSHIDRQYIRDAQAADKLYVTGNFAELAAADAVFICVPTPLTPQREPDMGHILQTAEKLRSHLPAGQLVVLESTTYPGTTDELLRGILEQSGKRVGTDFFLAFSPEREDPGNKSFHTATIPKVVGGVDTDSGDLAEALYAQVVERTVRVGSSRAAEAAKLTENIFRAVNIALVNELKMVFDRMGIDIWEVLDACSTKPFGFMRFNPGPGWGGHCIPLDPFYLTWKAREFGTVTKFIELAGEINIGMPEYVVGKLQLALNDRHKAVRDARILVLGLAYKKDVDDPRESPAFEIMDRLQRLGADLSYHDPHIPRSPRMRTWPRLAPMESRPLSLEVLSSLDAVVLVTDHSQVDYEFVARNTALIIDSRGVYRHTKSANIVPA